jgi:recombinational DNA repair protein RecT
MAEKALHEIADAMTLCTTDDGAHITKANMKETVPITKSAWSTYKKHYKEKAVKGVLWHIVGQLIKVRDEIEEAIENRDEKSEEILTKKLKHYKETVHIYLLSGVRPEEK